MPGDINSNGDRYLDALFSRSRSKEVIVEPRVEPKAVSMADTILCSPLVKEQIIEALKGKMKPGDPLQPKEVVLSVKIMTVPGLDINKAYLIDPSRISKTLDRFPTPSMGSACQNEYIPFNPPQHTPWHAHSLPGIGIASTNQIRPRWGLPVRADINIRCDTCNNSLTCNTVSVCPVTCASCKRHYFMLEDTEVEVPQICLGFAWENAKKDYQCDACALRTLYK